MAAPASGLMQRVGAPAMLLVIAGLTACQSSGPPPPMPPLRERSYACQVLGPGDTHEDEVLCELNKHMLER
jgi:hypothetical protein